MLYLIRFSNTFLGEGGDLTLFMTGKKERPSTEPLYSGGNRKDFPITTGFDSVEYTDLIGSYIKNSENILICQSLHDGRFSGCFAPSERYIPRPSVSWAIHENCNTFIELVKEKWNGKDGKPQNIYSLACDRNLHFGVFFMENYGTAQTIVTNTSDIKNKPKDGFKITACAAQGSTFYIIMTKGTKEYKGKPQAWFTCDSWGEAKNKIQKNSDNGKVITGICFSTGLGKYFAVMTKMPQGQIYKKFHHVASRTKWAREQHEEGFHPTIIFKDPTVKKTLVVMTKDENRSRSTCKYNVKLTF